MTEQDVKKLLSLIKTAFPSFEISENVITLWTNFIKGEDYETVTENFREYTLTNKFQPTIHDMVKPNENVLFRRRKQLSIQREKEDEERARLAVPPPWKRLGITQREFEEKLIAEGLLGDGSE